MILIIKNHIRRHKLVDITQQTIEMCCGQHFTLINRHGRYIDKPSLWIRKRREQGQMTVDIEDVLVFRKTPVVDGQNKSL